MADLTVGEIGKKLRLNLVEIDDSVVPAVQTPLDLTGTSKVQLSYVIGKINQQPAKTKEMSVVNAVSGIVEYTFVSTDLDKPAGMTEFAEFHYTVRVEYGTPAPSKILYSNEVHKLSIKDKIEV